MIATKREMVENGINDIYFIQLQNLLQSNRMDIGGRPRTIRLNTQLF